MNRKLFFAIITIVTAIAYLPGINGDFLNWDDTIYILNNTLIQGSISFDSFENLYNYDKNISLVLFSFLIQTKLTGSDPIYFHAFNILLHLINVTLAFKLFTFVLKKESYVLFATLLFAIHPLKVESVVWIIQRKDLMYSMFLMLSILSYISTLKNDKWYKYLFLFAFSFLASISKVQSLIIAPLLILCQYYFLGKITMRGLQVAITVFLLMITSLFSLHVYLFVVIIPFLVIINLVKIQNTLEKFIDRILKFKIQTFNQKLLTNKSFNYFIFLILGLFFAYFTTKVFIIIGTIFEVRLANLFDLDKYKLIINTSIYGLYILFFLLISSQLSSKTDFLYKKYKTSCKTISYNINKKILNHWMFVFIFLITLLVFVNVCNKDIDGKFMLHNQSHELILFLSVLLTLEMGYILNLIKNKLRFFGILITFVILVALSGFAFYFFTLSGQETLINNGIFNTLSMALYSLSYYVLRFVYTFDLTAMHVYPDKIVDAKYFFTSVVVFLFVTVLSIRAIFIGRKKKELKFGVIFGIGFFLVSIFPVLHFIPIEGKVIVADRYTYIPYLGFIILFVLLVGEFLWPFFKNIHRNIKFILPLVFVLLLFYQTFSRSKVWLNDFVFWSDVIAKNEANHYAWFSRGLYYYQEGSYLLAKNDYDKAIVLNDSDSEYFTNRAAVNIKLNIYANALNDLNTALSLNEDNLLALKSRIILYLETGELDLAHNDLTKLGNEYLRVFNTQEISDEVMVLKNAKDTFAKTSKPEPVLSDYYLRIGSNYAKINDFQLALKFFNLAVKYNVDNHIALLNRGNVYAMLKDFDNAKKDYYYLLGLNNSDCSIYLNLGNILHESGQVDSACYYWDVSRLKGCKNAQIMLDKFCLSKKR